MIRVETWFGKHSIEYTVYQVNIDGICIPNKDKDAYYTEDEHEAVNQALIWNKK
jgi:hypothetical protein